MDLATHAVASLALARGFFPRRPWPFAAGVVLAGTLADSDILTEPFGPDAYLAGYLTVAHSLIGTLFVVAMAVGYLAIFKPRYGPFPRPTPTQPASFAMIVLATSLAAVVHLLMDVAGSWGVALLWPFRTTRFAWDCLPFLDPWVLAILMMGIVLPELLALVGSEIGAKEEAPRGRNAALITLVLVVLYGGARAILHGNATAQLDGHAYRGESARKVAAFPDSFSIATWHGVVETASQVCTVEVPAAETARFDAETAVCVSKPEDSSALRAAQETAAAQKFLQAARFPKASVGITQSGTEVVIRDMRDAAQNNTGSSLAARILLDPNGQVTSQNIVWARNVKLR